MKLSQIGVANVQLATAEYDAREWASAPSRGMLLKGQWSQPSLGRFKMLDFIVDLEITASIPTCNGWAHV